MNVVILMLAVTACYTICSLNDKYAAAKDFRIKKTDTNPDTHCIKIGVRLWLQTHILIQVA